MKEVYFDHKESYLCQTCQKEFTFPSVPKEGVKCVTGLLPYCSQVCKFRKIFRLLKKAQFDQKKLELLNKNNKFYLKNEEFNHYNALFSLTRLYVNKDLLSINQELKKRSKGQGQEKKVMVLSKRSKGQDFPPYVIGGNDLTLTRFKNLTQNEKFDPFLKTKRNTLEKWW